MEEEKKSWYAEFESYLGRPWGIIIQIAMPLIFAFINCLWYLNCKDPFPLFKELILKIILF